MCQCRLSNVAIFLVFRSFHHFVCQPRPEEAIHEHHRDEMRMVLEEFGRANVVRLEEQSPEPQSGRKKGTRGRRVTRPRANRQCRSAFGHRRCRLMALSRLSSPLWTLIALDNASAACMIWSTLMSAALLGERVHCIGDDGARQPHLHGELVGPPGFLEIAPQPRGLKPLQLNDLGDRLQLDGQRGRIHGGCRWRSTPGQRFPRSSCPDLLAGNTQQLSSHHCSQTSRATRGATWPSPQHCIGMHVPGTWTENLVCPHERGLDLLVRMQSSPRTVWKPMKTSAVATLQVTNVNMLNTSLLPSLLPDFFKRPN